jgi:excisionase family DNA binding protein
MKPTPVIEVLIWGKKVGALAADPQLGCYAFAYPGMKPAIRAEEKLLLSRRDAAQVLSISQRALDYLVATRRLPTRRIGGRVLIPVADLRKYARADHPEPIVG